MSWQKYKVPKYLKNRRFNYLIVQIVALISSRVNPRPRPNKLINFKSDH